MEPKHRSKELEAARHPPLPGIGEQVVVQCEGYRCLAYRDKEGKWRSALGGELLPNVLKVLEQF